jgi:hypothetical protein
MTKLVQYPVQYEKRVFGGFVSGKVSCAYLLSRIFDEVTDERPDDQYLQSLFGWFFSDEELTECDALVQAIREQTPDWLFNDQPDLRRSVGNIELFDYIYPEFVGTYGD